MSIIGASEVIYISFGTKLAWLSKFAQISGCTSPSIDRYPGVSTNVGLDSGNKDLEINSPNANRQSKFARQSIAAAHKSLCSWNF
jgi:hypothetical protein